jgi:hypothetical protein
MCASDTILAFTYNPASQLTSLTSTGTDQYEYLRAVTATDNGTYDGLNRDASIVALWGGMTRAAT